MSKRSRFSARRRRAFSSKNDEFWVVCGNLGIFGTCHLDAQAKARFRAFFDIFGVCNELKCQEMLECGDVKICKKRGASGLDRGLGRTSPPLVGGVYRTPAERFVCMSVMLCYVIYVMLCYVFLCV